MKIFRRKKYRRYVVALCMIMVTLTACSGEREARTEKENGTATQALTTEPMLAENFTDKSYPFCNSTNLYKNVEEDYMRERPAKSDAVFAQYDLQGNFLCDIVIKDAYSLLSVDDEWIYYLAFRKDKGAICRIPLQKKDGLDVVDVSREEILLYPGKITKEEKEQGITDKMFIDDGNCWITPKYILYFVSVDLETEEEFCAEELVRYNLETGEYNFRIWRDQETGNDLGNCVSSSGETIIFGEDTINILDVEKMEVNCLWEEDEFEAGDGTVVMTLDGSMLCYVDCDDDYDANRIYLYSLKERKMMTVIERQEIMEVICLGEEMDQKEVTHMNYQLIGCYKDRLYLRYLLEKRQDDAAARYGVLSMPLSGNGKLAFEKEITDAVRQESVPYHGQRIRYKKISKKEKQSAKKAGKQPEKKIDTQYSITVNLGNPQRIIGNQLFFRSINPDVSQNGWFCYQLDTKKSERLTREDGRNQWIYCQRSEGWNYYGGSYLLDDVSCLEDEENGLVKIVWDDTEKQSVGTQSEQKADITDQLKYLAKHRMEWTTDIASVELDGCEGYDDILLGKHIESCNYGYGMEYIVTDLNQNGRLEIIALDQMGSGGFTNICAYEYSDKTRSLQRVTNNIEGEGWVTVPDIGGMQQTDVYYNEKKDVYWYFGSDYTHISGTENWNSICLWTISPKGSFQCREYGYILYAEPQNSYYIGDQIVKKKQFQAKRNNMEPDMRKGKTTLQWQHGGRDLMEMSEEELLEKLTKSWEGFSIKW